MTEIVSGIVMFTLVVLLLVATLLVAKRKLVAHGDVTITVNDDPAKRFYFSPLKPSPLPKQAD